MRQLYDLRTTELFVSVQVLYKLFRLSPLLLILTRFVVWKNKRENVNSINMIFYFDFTKHAYINVFLSTSIVSLLNNKNFIFRDNSLKKMTLHIKQKNRYKKSFNNIVKKLFKNYINKQI